MQAIMETVYHYFAVEQDAEITIECNPGTITEHKFEVYRKNRNQPSEYRITVGAQ